MDQPSNMSAMTAEQRLERANQQRLSDDFNGARETCHAILAEHAGHAGAMCMLGICDIETGDVDNGAGWLDRAEAVAPDLPQLHLYRSMQFEAQHRLPDALEAAQTAYQHGPDRFDVAGRLGDLAGRAGDFALAAQALARAIECEPHHPAVPQLALRLAGARVETGDVAGTEAALSQAERGGLAGHPEVLRLRAALSRQAADWTALARHAQAWVEAAPGDHEARSALALALSQQGYYKRATEIYRPVLSADINNAENWAALGRLVLGARDVEEATTCFNRALEIDADCADATFGLARVHTMTGDLEAAEAMCRRTLEIDPQHLEAFGQLSEVSSGRISDAELQRLAETVDVPGMPDDKLSIGLFALGDVYHRRKMRAEAFATWNRANAAKKRQHGHDGDEASGYSADRQTALIDRLMACFDTDGGQGGLESDGHPTPVFIVGMPRSGTTLIEAAISAHEAAAPAGELSGMPFILQDFVKWAEATDYQGGPIPEAQLDVWRQKYLGQYAEFGLDQARWVTDKQPANFLAVGLIRQIFPDAPIVQIRRKPVETAFSIFRRNFSRLWPFAHDLDNIAHYYAEHARLCAHWEATIDRKFTVLQYEDLVRDFEGKLRWVLARCGLPWSRQCLEFYNIERTVMTFSAVQVRKPPSADHLDSTSAYAEFLDGFDARMAALGVDPETGALAGGNSDDTDDGARGKRGGLLGRLLGSGG